MATLRPTRPLPAEVPPVAPPVAPRSTYQSPDLTGKTFLGRAPAATPYGDFVAPVPGSLSAAGQFRLDEGLKARERSAAARGTLLTGGLQKALERFSQGLASEEYGNDFNRAMQ